MRVGKAHVKKLEGTEDNGDIQVMSAQRVSYLFALVGSLIKQKNQMRTYEGQDGGEHRDNGHKRNETRARKAESIHQYLGQVQEIP